MSKSSIEVSSIERCRSCFGVGKALRLTGTALTAATLAACAQSSVVTDKSAFHVGSRSTATDHGRKVPRKTGAQTATITNNHAPVAAADRGPETRDASLGLASYYQHGSLTASGEQFDAHQLTAAHPTLPFGTRLRVTNLATGQSVTVRVNDRGPFVRGRVVDVSYSAAESLGLVGRGVAKVKLDVVQ
jgi:rare lipoprotein A